MSPQPAAQPYDPGPYHIQKMAALERHRRDRPRAVRQDSPQQKQVMAFDAHPSDQALPVTVDHVQFIPAGVLSAAG